MVPMLRTCWSAIVAAAAERQAVAARGHVVVAHHRAEAQDAALAGDALELLDAPQVDEQRGRRQPQLHQRDQRVPAGEQLGVLAAVAQRGQRLVERPGRHVVELSGDQRFASWMASQTRMDPSGMLM